MPASGTFQKRTIVERQGTDDQGGAIQILGIPDSQREHNSLVFSLACTCMFGTSYFSNIATQNNSLTADIRISWPSSSQLDSELGSSSVPVDPMATGTGSTSPRIAAMADPVIGDVVPPTGLDMPTPVTPQELLTPQKFVFSQVRTTQTT